MNMELSNPPRVARILVESEVRELISMKAARAAVAEAFALLAMGKAVLPAVMDIDVVEHHGEFHAKGAYLRGAPFYSIKTASGFFENPAKGLPAGEGVTLVFDAETGLLQTVIFDGGFLTDLRTAAAGAVAAEYLSATGVTHAAIIGAGVQGRYQLSALRSVRPITHATIFDLDAAKAKSYALEMGEADGLTVTVANSVEDAVRDAQIVVTTTPSRAPYLRAEWLRPGVHITAMGSDMPAKQELDPGVLGVADKVVADYLAQCLTQGEIHHAIKAGAMTAADVYGDLGEIVAGLKPGREGDSEITVVDLTGVGVQDAAVANIVAGEAARRGLGRTLSELSA
jgi:ornithine cyclodeaminase